MKDWEKKIEQQLERLKYLSMVSFRKKKQTDGPRYGDVYERALAAAIDVSLIFWMLSWLFNRITAGLFSHIDMSKVAAIDPKVGIPTIVAQLWDARMIQWWLINFAIQLLIIGIFYVACQIVYNTTPGKWLMGLKIVRHGTDESPKRWQYVLRYVAYIPSCAPLMVGVMWAAFNKQRRTWHDYIARTDVISLRPHGWYWEQTKRGFRYVKAKLKGSAPLEQPVGKPAAEQRHADGEKPVE